MGIGDFGENAGESGFLRIVKIIRSAHQSSITTL